MSVLDRIVLAIGALLACFGTALISVLAWAMWLDARASLAGTELLFVGGLLAFFALAAGFAATAMVILAVSP